MRMICVTCPHCLDAFILKTDALTFRTLRLGQDWEYQIYNHKRMCEIRSLVSSINQEAVNG